MLCHATEQTHNFDNIIYDGCATKRMNAWWLVFGFDLDGWRRLSLFLSLFFFYIACECLFVFFYCCCCCCSSLHDRNKYGWVWLRYVFFFFFESSRLRLSLFLYFYLELHQMLREPSPIPNRIVSNTQHNKRVKSLNAFFTPCTRHNKCVRVYIVYRASGMGRRRRHRRHERVHQQQYESFETCMSIMARYSL